MLKIFVAFLSLILFVSAFQLKTNSDISSMVSIPWPFSICGTGRWNIESLTISILPARNTNNDMDVMGTATSSVSFKRVDLLVKINNVFLHSESVDFIKSYDQGDIIQFRYKNYIPQFAPSGTYSISFTWINDKGTAQGCLLMQFKL